MVSPVVMPESTRTFFEAGGGTWRVRVPVAGRKLLPQSAHACRRQHRGVVGLHAATRRHGGGSTYFVGRSAYTRASMACPVMLSSSCVFGSGWPAATCGPAWNPNARGDFVQSVRRAQRSTKLGRVKGRGAYLELPFDQILASHHFRDGVLHLRGVRGTGMTDTRGAVRQGGARPARVRTCRRVFISMK